MATFSVKLCHLTTVLVREVLRTMQFRSSGAAVCRTASQRKDGRKAVIRKEFLMARSTTKCNFEYTGLPSQVGKMLLDISVDSELTQQLFHQT